MSNTGLLEANPAEVETQAEPACSHCGRMEPWTESEWCPSCGYSRKFDRVFDVGSDSWEEPEASLADALPMWVRVMGAGIVGIFVLGVMARLQYTPRVRGFWTAGQVLVGMFVFGWGHVAAYLQAASESDRFGPVDLFMKPFSVWKPTTRDLPRTARRVWMAAWGMTSIFVGLFVVGGINWSTIFEDDWGFKRQAKGNLVHQIVEKARKEKGEGADNLEEALDDFAGEEKEDKEPEEEKTVPKLQADALIIGYTKTRAGEIEDLLLASVYDNKLTYSGPLGFDTLPEEDRRSLAESFGPLQRPTPFVEVPVAGAVWLQPRKLVRVKLVEWSRRGRMMGPVFDDVLDDVRAR